MLFNMSLVTVINILLVALIIGVCGLCFMQIRSFSFMQTEIRSYFKIFFAFLNMYCTTHLVREVLNGLPGTGARYVLYIVTCIEIITAGFVANMVSVLILFVSKAERPQKAIISVLMAFLAVHIVVVIACSYTGLIYYFDEVNTYHRGSGYLISNLCPLLMIIIDIVLLIRYSSNFERRIKTAFWAYILFPIAAIVIQSLFFGLQLIIFATAAASVNMFFIIVYIQNERFEKQKMDSSRIETELSLATKIQADMLPSLFPAFPDREEFDLYASMTPAKEVGGDFYDFFMVDDDHLGLVIADVSGKGVPAAMFMMFCKNIIANNVMLGKSPAKALEDANESVCANSKNDMFVTVWVGLLEISTGKMLAASAGHEYPFITNADGKFELYKDKHGLVVGAMEGVKYKEYELQMYPGSKIFVYTDGVPEANNSSEELFGMDRLKKALGVMSDSDPKVVLEGIRCAVDEFADNAEQFDDLTMLCLEYKGQKS